jgi:hypothetical protein
MCLPSSPKCWRGLRISVSRGLRVPKLWTGAIAGERSGAYTRGMLIAQVEPPHVTRGGDWYYRTFSPGLAMAEHEDVHVVDLTNIHRQRDAILVHADVLVLNMVCDSDLLPVVADRTRRGLVTIFEVNDDVAQMEPFNPVAGFYAHAEHQVLFRMLVRTCDAAQFCTPELKRIYGSLNSRTAVFPNQVARQACARTGVAAGDEARTVIGWGGSFGHLKDIAEVADPLIDWLQRRNDVVLQLMCADKIWALFERLEPGKKRHVPTGTIEEYHAFIAGLDLGIAPMQDTGYNRCRSDVKFLEYAQHGVAAVVRALVPYETTVEHRVTGMLFRDSAEMLALLDELVDNPLLRRAIAAEAAAYVGARRSERLHSVDRIDFYRSISSPHRAAASGTGDDLVEKLARLEGAEVRGRHITLNPTRYEVLLHEALVIGQLESRTRDAANLLEQAAKLEPNAYQPHLFGAGMSTSPIDWLQEALKRNPKSLQAHVQLAERLAQAGQVGPALSSLLAAAEVHPAYDIPYQRLAEFLTRWNQPVEAKRFLEAAAALRRPFLELPTPQT